MVENVARRYRYVGFEGGKRIARLWSIGTPAQVIAEEIGTDPATISRELRRGIRGRTGETNAPRITP
ncbi:MAG: helix-turn-helix domain-containing protein [Oscillospiraceae bacterium]|nr:helix-turn-helix domain-containing protein [Oscillospiraceae bacterium]